MKFPFFLIAGAVSMCALFGVSAKSPSWAAAPRPTQSPYPTRPPRATHPPLPTKTPRPTKVPGLADPVILPTSTVDTPSPTTMPTAEATLAAPTATTQPTAEATDIPATLTPTATALPATETATAPTSTQTSTPAFSPTPTETVTSTAIPSSTPDSGASKIALMLQQANAYRVLSGCAALTLNDKLTSAAMSHSQDMAQNDFLSHTGSNGSSAADRATAAGYTWQTIGENIAVGMDSPVDATNSWYGEVPPNDFHRRNLLDCTFTDVGIGYFYLANDTGTVTYQHYWTMLLAS